MRSRSLLYASLIAMSLGGPAAAWAQTFFEFGGGTSYLAPASGADSYGRAFNLRASIGRKIAPDLSIRLDGFANQFSDRTFVPSHLNNPGGLSDLYPVNEAAGVTALTADLVAGIDSRGILYVLGGAGVYDAYHARPWS